MKREKLNEYLDRYRAEKRFSGSVRITHKDKIIYQKFAGMADIENEVPLTEDSVFTL